MSQKVPQIHIEVLKSYKKIEKMPILGKNLTQIAESLMLNYKTVYVMNVSAMLIRNGYIDRQFDDHGAVVYTITEKGNELIGLEEDMDMIDNEVDESSVFIPLVDSKNAKPVVIKEPVQKTNGFVIDEADKEKAILSLLNDTLLKTVVYCKDLSDQLKTVEREEHILDIERQLEDTQNELRRAKLLIKEYESDVEKSKEAMPTVMDMLKCGIDSKLDDFFELIPWQRELVRDQLKKDLMTLVEEAKEDIQKIIIPEDTNMND